MTETALEFLLRRDRAIVGAALAVLMALAWVYMVWLAGNMDGMSTDGMPTPSSGGAAGVALARMRPWTPAEFVAMFVMWAVMMVGMMVPSASPMVLLYARVGRLAAARGKPLAATGFFAGGYLLAWTAFSLAATLGQWGLDAALLLNPMMASANSTFSGLVLVAAGLFQWTPQKDACLKHCRAPLSFIQQHGGFRRDAQGSLAVGFRHGLYCIGCCWALMALLFVGGVMNIFWIAAISVLVLAEKVAPAGRLVSRVAGSMLLAAGTLLLVGMPP